MTKAFALSESFKVIGTEGRISGQWVALIAADSDRRTWISPHDVTIFDEQRRSGILIFASDMAASVLNGNAEITRTSERRGPDIEEVADEMRALLVEIERAARADVEIRRHDV